MQFTFNTYEPSTEPRRLFRNTNWSRVLQVLQAEVERLPSISTTPVTPQQIDDFTQKLVLVVQETVFQFTPIAKPSPYSKRWWNQDLTQLKKAYTAIRNVARA
jgi:hypothetical protein